MSGMWAFILRGRIALNMDAEYNIHRAFVGNDNRFWLDPEYVDGSELTGKGTNPAEIMIFFIARDQANLPDCPEWHINKAWKELDNDAVAEILSSVTRIHVYDIYAGQEGILTRNPR